MRSMGVWCSPCIDAFQRSNINRRLFSTLWATSGTLSSLSWEKTGERALILVNCLLGACIEVIIGPHVHGRAGATRGQSEVDDEGMDEEGMAAAS